MNHLLATRACELWRYWRVWRGDSGYLANLKYRFCFSVYWLSCRKHACQLGSFPIPVTLWTPSRSRLALYMTFSVYYITLILYVFHIPLTGLRVFFIQQNEAFLFHKWQTHICYNQVNDYTHVIRNTVQQNVVVQGRHSPAYVASRDLFVPGPDYRAFVRLAVFHWSKLSVDIWGFPADAATYRYIDRSKTKLCQ